jgi:Tfp pilus assembly protein PilX
MAEALLVRKGGATPTIVLSSNSFNSGETSAGTALTVNSGNVGEKKIAIVTGFIVGANTNTPTLTCTMYGSNDGTNFTQIGTALSIQKTNASVTAGRVASKEFDAKGYTYYRVTTNSVSSGTSFGYSVSLTLV